MAKKNASFDDAFERLARSEKDFLRQEFLAPVRKDRRVEVRIAGVRCQMTVQPAEFEGFGVFRPVSAKRAKLIRPAKMAERQAYLKLLPGLDLILVGREATDWAAAPAQSGDARFKIEGLVPLQLVDDAERFEVVTARFDGMQFWHEGPSRQADPGHAVYLREALIARTPAAELRRKGLSRLHRDAYEKVLAGVLRAEAEARRHSQEGRLQAALEHAGARLVQYAERGDVVTVSYMVDGRRHTSVVNGKNLTVFTAGICLSGEDGKFDLASLVGVLREGRNRGEG